MRNARKHLVWVLGLALALAVSGVAEAVSTQHLEAGINKNSLPTKKKKKKKYKRVALTVHTFTEGTADVGPLPTFPSQTQTADLHIGKGFKFTTKGLPQCNQNDPAFQNGTSEAVIAACGPNGTASGGEDATVGSGAARALTPLPPPNDNVPVEVNAFNGIPQNGNPTILLHSRADSLDNTTPLVGELDGRTDLRIAVPQLAAGFAVLSDLEATVDRKYKPSKAKKKKNKFYVGARCKNGNAGLNITSDWTYYDGAAPASNVQNETPIEPC